MIDKLVAHDFVVWFRANEWEAFEEDLMTSALHLKSELLRFDTVPANSREGRDSQRHPRLYFSDGDARSLTRALEVWMNQDRSSRKIVILDDLDGLDVAHHRTISRMFAADAIDLIYTARDPLMADTGMIWEAKDFEVPALQGEQAAALLLSLMTDMRFQRRNQTILNSHYASVPDTKKVIMANVVNRLGAIPAAIIIASHYAKDHFGSTESPRSFERLLHDWDHGDILNFRRDMLKYTHTILESFELSKTRLQRNTGGKSDQNLYRISLTALKLLSALHLSSFRREALDVFCKTICEYDLNHSDSPLDGDLRLLCENPSMINPSVTELIRVSLLSGPDADGNIKLNTLTTSCVLLNPDFISPDERSMLQSLAEYFHQSANGIDFCKTSIDTGRDP